MLYLNPDISNLIQISDLMSVSVDYLVKDQDCAVSIKSQPDTDLDELIAFRLEANVNTYAAFKNEVDATRPDSHDFRYENGKYIYHDTYVGGEEFTEMICFDFATDDANHDITLFLGIIGTPFLNNSSYDIICSWRAAL